MKCQPAKLGASLRGCCLHPKKSHLEPDHQRPTHVRVHHPTQCQSHNRLGRTLATPPAMSWLSWRSALWRGVLESRVGTPPVPTTWRLWNRQTRACHVGQPGLASAPLQAARRRRGRPKKESRAGWGSWWRGDQHLGELSPVFGIRVGGNEQRTLLTTGLQHQGHAACKD